LHRPEVACAVFTQDNHLAIDDEMIDEGHPKLARAPHGHAMIENIRSHPYTRAVCVETACLFEQRAARDLVKAQYWADRGAQDQARELQAKARLAQQRATAWHFRARNAADLASAAAVASCHRSIPSRNREKEINESQT